MFYEMQKGVFTEKLPKDFRESMEELRKKPLGKVATAAIAGVAFPVVVYLSYHLPEYINNVKEVVGEGLQTIANGGPEIPNNLPDASRFKRYIPFIFR